METFYINLRLSFNINLINPGKMSFTELIFVVIIIGASLGTGLSNGERVIPAKAGIQLISRHHLISPQYHFTGIHKAVILAFPD
jgi:hypothetical protein